jgi:hypothetical protein
VKARETAERDTPALLATSSALTKILDDTALPIPSSDFAMLCNGVQALQQQIMMTVL